tara:strand:+ start:378 stop:611 length:234 start_codon:yes stop_codon:yes gene_type:complete
MATLNFIMPQNLRDGLCERKEKEHKMKHTWLPSGQSRADITGNISVECFCKHCDQREWANVSRLEFELLQDHWLELR